MSAANIRQQALAKLTQEERQALGLEDLQDKVQRFVAELRYRRACLEETWQQGYSWNYRWYRLKETLFPGRG